MQFYRLPKDRNVSPVIWNSAAGKVAHDINEVVCFICMFLHLAMYNFHLFYDALSQCGSCDLQAINNRI